MNTTGLINAWAAVWASMGPNNEAGPTIPAS